MFYFINYVFFYFSLCINLELDIFCLKEFKIYYHNKKEKIHLIKILYIGHLN